MPQWSLYLNGSLLAFQTIPDWPTQLLRMQNLRTKIKDPMAKTPSPSEEYSQKPGHYLFNSQYVVPRDCGSAIATTLTNTHNNNALDHHSNAGFCAFHFWPTTRSSTSSLPPATQMLVSRPPLVWCESSG